METVSHISCPSAHVAIVGSGPSGFYAAEALLRSGQNIAVDMFEKLPVPFGLVRFGVAPDHPKLKKVTAVFDRIAHMKNFRFFGNVEIGRDVSVEMLSEHYHAVIFACGAENEKDLGIPGEHLPGSHSARAFVAWYNGHPDYHDLNIDLSHETAVIIGQGNVSLDVARILAKDVGELQKTDIAEHALEILAESRIKSIHIIGRRGPVQARFTSKELREFNTLSSANCHLDSAYLDLNHACLEELQNNKNTEARLNLEIFRKLGFHNHAKKSRNIHFDFLRAPIAVNGLERVESICLERTSLSGSAFHQQPVGTNIFDTLKTGLVIRCIGYRAKPLNSLAIDDIRGVLMNKGGRCMNNEKFLLGLYVTGWAKRGATGTIGTNRGDSVETVEAVLADLKDLRRKAPVNELLRQIKNLKHSIVEFDVWKRIDAIEKDLGENQGKPRTKLVAITQLLEAAKPTILPTITDQCIRENLQ